MHGYLAKNNLEISINTTIPEPKEKEIKEKEIFFNRDSLNQSLLRFYFNCYDHILKGVMSFYVKQHNQNPKIDILAIDDLARMDAQRYLGTKNNGKTGLKQCIEVLCKKEILHLNGKILCYKNPNDLTYTLDISDFNDYKILHQGLFRKNKEGKEIIKDYILYRFQNILKSKDAFNIESKVQELGSSFEKLRYCSFYAFEEAFAFFTTESKMTVDTFHEKVRKYHEDRKSHAVRFIEDVITTLKPKH